MEIKSNQNWNFR